MRPRTAHTDVSADARHFTVNVDTDISTGMKREELIEAIHKGAHEANRFYCKWTDGLWITDYGVEGFMVSHICHSIQDYRQDRGYLSMEEPFEEMIRSSGRRSPGRRTERMTGSKRVDIALWNEQELVTHVIEVKRQWNQACYHDLDRLYDLQRKLRSIQCGIFVMFVVVEGDESVLQDRIDDLSDEVTDYLDAKTDCKYRICECPAKYGPYHNEDWTGTSFCVEIYGRHAN